MSEPSWPGLRPGSVRVSVYNEALLVYLYDESNLPALEASGADFESGYAEDEADIDPALRRLARDGVLVAYELFQDDPVELEVAVGPPLSEAEVAAGRWRPPQTAALALPGGVLRVDTANTLPVGSDEPPEEEPGRVPVPPGDYTLSLYRLDWDRVEADGLLEGGRAWGGPTEALVLTPVEPGTDPGRRNKARALLRA